jgi:hypothetical protein
MAHGYTLMPVRSFMSKRENEASKFRAAVPEGWTAELVTNPVTQQQQAALEQLNLKPGEVCKLTK